MYKLRRDLATSVKYNVLCYSEHHLRTRGRSIPIPQILNVLCCSKCHSQAHSRKMQDL